MLQSIARARQVEAAQKTAESIARVEAKLDQLAMILASVVERLDHIDPRPPTTPRKDR